MGKRGKENENVNSREKGKQPPKRFVGKANVRKGGGGLRPYRGGFTTSGCPLNGVQW